ncbi:MAG: transposase, partial [Rhodobacteraceae bacterium]|nr:transposase [Paracoccaceae bacterium]
AGKRPSYNTAPKQRGALSIRFDPDMNRMSPPSNKCGRQQRFSDAAIHAIQTCLTTLKILVRYAAQADRGLCGKPVATGRTGRTCRITVPCAAAGRR